MGEFGLDVISGVPTPNSGNGQNQTRNSAICGHAPSIVDSALKATCQEPGFRGNVRIKGMLLLSEI